MVWTTLLPPAIAADQAPVWISRPVTNAVVGQPYEYFLHATDPDGEAVDYLPVTTPAWLGIADAPEPRIYTVAGSLERGSGKPALQVQLASPSTGVYDAAGNLFVADIDNHRVWKLAPDGTMTVIAGTGEPGYGGDGGSALRARLASPIGVTVDNQGNVFIADRDNHRVRRVSSTGLILTVAGTGEPGFSGDGGPAQAARLNTPCAVAWSPAGRLYIADTENHRVREISPTGFISTFAGTGDTAFNGDGIPAVTASLQAPSGLVVPPPSQGLLLIADTAHNRVRRVTPSGLIETVAGNGTAGFAGDNGPATQARLDNPRGLAASTAGVWIADTRNNRVRRVAPDGTIATVAGIGRYGFRGDGGPAKEAWMVLALGVALTPADTFLVFDTYNARLREVNAAGIIQTVAGTGTPTSTGDGGPATAAMFNQPRGVAAGPGGVIYVADSLSHKVRQVSPDGTVTTVAGTGVGGYGGDGGAGVEAQLFNPAGLAVDTAGNLYIADQGNHRIRRLSPDGTIARFAGTGEPGYDGSGGLAILAKLRDPYGLAFDAAGNLYVAELGNHRVRRIGTDGIIHDVAGTGESGFSGDGGAAMQARLNHPQGVAVDAAGHLYIADSDNHRIRRVGADGKISTIAGTGVAGFSGDGAAATAARLNHPEGIAVGADGSLLIADYWNHRIRQVLPNGRIATVIGSGSAGPAGGGYSGDGGPPALATMLHPTDVKLAANGDWLTVESRMGVVRRVFQRGKVLRGTPAADAAGSRDVALRAVAGSLAATQTFALVVEAPPAITLQPRPQAVLTGSAAIFTVAASGTQPLSYQWLRNGAALADFGRISGTATPQLSVADARMDDAGTYSVLILNNAGRVLSAAAQLTVNPAEPPVFTVQPESRQVLAGTTVILAGGAFGSLPISYRWYRDGLALADSERINGTATPELRIAAFTAADAGAYTLVATNAGGSATSNPAMLTLDPRQVPVITAEPQAQRIEAGGMVQFTVTAAGTPPLGYQWKRNGVPLANSGRYSGVNSATFTITGARASDQGDYTVTVANAVGSATSAPAALTVEQPTMPTLAQAGLRHGRIVLLVSGPAGRRCEIESAPDFVSWSKLTEVTLTATPVEVTDAVTGQARFYRALIR
jgi:sugar lactone lactonase YvrE